MIGHSPDIRRVACAKAGPPQYAARPRGRKPQKRGVLCSAPCSQRLTGGPRRGQALVRARRRRGAPPALVRRGRGAGHGERPICGARDDRRADQHPARGRGSGGRAGDGRSHRADGRIARRGAARDGPRRPDARQAGAQAWSAPSAAGSSDGAASIEFGRQLDGGSPAQPLSRRTGRARRRRLQRIGA